MERFLVALFMLMTILFKTTASLCSDYTGCMKSHLENSGLEQMLQRRCELSNINPTNRSLRFVHIPETGFGDVLPTLKEKYPYQFSNQHQHAHFLALYQEDPNAIFGLLYRDPASILISFYDYVNQRNVLNQKMRGDYMWQQTFKKEPIAWAQDPAIQIIFDQLLLRQFSTSFSSALPAADRVAEGGDYMTRYFAGLNLHPSAAASMVPWMNAKTEASIYLNAVSELPERYACIGHARVAVTLLTRFSAVGVYENLSGFYAALFHHMEDHTGNISTNTTVNNNITRGRDAHKRFWMSSQKETRSQTSGMMSAADARRVRDMLTYHDPGPLPGPLPLGEDSGSPRQSKGYKAKFKSNSKSKTSSKGKNQGKEKTIADSIALAKALAAVDAKDTLNEHADAFFCSTMMWRLMVRINEADLACIQ